MSQQPRSAPLFRPQRGIPTVRTVNIQTDYGFRPFTWAFRIKQGLTEAEVMAEAVRQTRSFGFTVLL